MSIINLDDISYITWLNCLILYSFSLKKAYENINRWVGKLKSELPYYRECNEEGIAMFKDWVKARQEAAAAAAQAAMAAAAQAVRKNSRS